MRATPSRTSSTVPTSLVSTVARSADAISLRRMSLSSPGRSTDSVAMSRAPVSLKGWCAISWGVACEIYHIEESEATGALQATSRMTVHETPEQRLRAELSELPRPDARHAPGRGSQVTG